VRTLLKAACDGPVCRQQHHLQIDRIMRMLRRKQHQLIDRLNNSVSSGVLSDNIYLVAALCGNLLPVGKEETTRVAGIHRFHKCAHC
jgi:hypothetical protein